MYQLLFNFFNKYFKKKTVFKYGFNWSPMYRRSVGRIKNVSEDLHSVTIEIPLNYKNRNYIGSIFGGSLFSATDPIYMIQLIHILGNDYVVWDKAAAIKYKRPAKEKAYAVFQFSKEEIDTIKRQVNEKNEIDFVKKLNLVSKEGQVFAELEKTIYIASKAHYKSKLAARSKSKKA